jgi:hypothetical protein
LKQTYVRETAYAIPVFHKWKFYHSSDRLSGIEPLIITRDEDTSMIE